MPVTWQSAATALLSRTRRTSNKWKRPAYTIPDEVLRRCRAEAFATPRRCVFADSKLLVTNEELVGAEYCCSSRKQKDRQYMDLSSESCIFKPSIFSLKQYALFTNERSMALKKENQRKENRGTPTTVRHHQKQHKGAKWTQGSLPTAWWLHTNHSITWV